MEKAPSRTQAAKDLGISIRTLRNKLNEYGVKTKDEEGGSGRRSGRGTGTALTFPAGSMDGRRKAALAGRRFSRAGDKMHEKTVAKTGS